MIAPNLNRKLVLEASQKIADGAGGFTEIWVALGTVWADVAARTGRERAEGGAPVSTMSYKITVRGAPVGSAARPQPDQRFRDGGRTLLIQAVAERDPQGRYLTCFADEEVAS